MSVFAYHGWCADPDCRVRGLEEDNKRLEALVRAKDETLGELLELLETSCCDECYAYAHGDRS